MKICVVGTGYVGLVSGTCLAEVGHEVACVDLDADKVARINRGEPPIHEDGLEALLRKHAGTRLTATTSLADAIGGAEVALICVGTPFDGKTIDLGYVRQVARDIGAVLRTHEGYCVVTVKSTASPALRPFSPNEMSPKKASKTLPPPLKSCAPARGLSSTLKGLSDERRAFAHLNLAPFWLQRRRMSHCFRWPCVARVRFCETARK